MVLWSPPSCHCHSATLTSIKLTLSVLTTGVFRSKAQLLTNRRLSKVTASNYLPCVSFSAISAACLFVKALEIVLKTAQFPIVHHSFALPSLPPVLRPRSITSTLESLCPLARSHSPLFNSLSATVRTLNSFLIPDPVSTRP